MKKKLNHQEQEERKKKICMSYFKRVVKKNIKRQMIKQNLTKEKRKRTLKGITTIKIPTLLPPKKDNNQSIKNEKERGRKKPKRLIEIDFSSDDDHFFRFSSLTHSF